MALRTLGTNATTSLSAMFFHQSTDLASSSNLALLNAAIQSDLGTDNLPPNIGRDGQLWIPRRGWLRVLPGDYIGVDSTGWPILLSANTIANGPWTHS